MVRSKHRYIATRIMPVKKNRNITQVRLKNSDLYATVLSKVKKIHGDFGFACVKTGFICNYCNEMTGVAIFKIRHSAHKFVSSILPLISEIRNENVQLHTIRTTATLQQAYKYLKIYQQRQLEQIWNTLDETKRKEMRSKFENLSEVEKLVMSSNQIRMKK